MVRLTAHFGAQRSAALLRAALRAVAGRARAFLAREWMPRSIVVYEDSLFITNPKRSCVELVNQQGSVLYHPRTALSVAVRQRRLARFKRESEANLAWCTPHAVRCVHSRAFGACLLRAALRVLLRARHGR
jgi:hypothetical protein